MFLDAPRVAQVETVVLPVVAAGTHTRKVADRFPNHLLPFFDQHPCFVARCR